MKRVYLARHGQTFSNVNKTFQGPDEELTDEGKQQARRLAERASNLDFQKFIVSDFKRAQMTARPITELTGIEPVISPLFHEQQVPLSWVGEPESSEKGVKFWHNLYHNASEATWYEPDMETPPQVLERVQKALSYLLQQEGDILVVSHGCFLKQLIAYLLLGEKADVDDIARVRFTLKTANTGISAIIHDGSRWRVLTWNDHAHFAE